MKIVLDVQLNGELKENDIIVCVKGKWTVVSKTNFLADVLEAQHLKNASYEESIKKLEDNLKELALIVKEK